jgi:hypothetical protein
MTIKEVYLKLGEIRGLLVEGTFNKNNPTMGGENITKSDGAYREALKLYNTLMYQLEIQENIK